ncbi:MAG TPA: hypothetical protein VMH89_05105, partial [Candidatus Acidoferrum sp.]|nr:hypothetical protein [Candidatus Acidoferrum sp.]
MALGALSACPDLEPVGSMVFPVAVSAVSSADSELAEWMVRLVFHHPEAFHRPAVGLVVYRLLAVFPLRGEGSEAYHHLVVCRRMADDTVACVPAAADATLPAGVLADVEAGNRVDDNQAGNLDSSRPTNTDCRNTDCRRSTQH